MDKTADLMRSVRSAFASIDTALALIEQGSGPNATLYEGYSVGRARSLLIDARKKVSEAQVKLSSALEQKPARKEAV